MTPGPIAVNSATFVGNQIAGVPGAFVATLGCILPSILFVTFLAKMYTKYRKLSIMQGVLESLRPAVVAMILTAGITILIPTFFASGHPALGGSNLQLRAIFYFIAALLFLRKFKTDPIKVMVFCGIAEVVYQVAI